MKPTPWVEDVRIAKRRKLSPRQRQQILLDNPHCYLCNIGFEADDEIEIDHVIPLELGGLDDPSNLKPAHKRPCHLRKTRRDIEMIAKAKRLEAKRKGIVGRKLRKIPGRSFPRRKPRQEN